MKKHLNPYMIRDHENWLEVTENSSHPELEDAKRIWIFGGYTFYSATEVDKFFAAEGLKKSEYVAEPVLHRDFGKNKVIISIVPKHQSRNLRGMRSISA